MEVPNERRIQDPPLRNPVVLLRAITLPIHQVLIALPTGTEQAPHGVSWSTLNKPGVWQGPGGGLKGTFLDRFEARSMERGVDPHGLWEAEVDRSRVDDTDDREGTHKARHQYLRFHPQWQVTGGKPNLLAWGVLRGWEATPAGVSLIPLRGAK